MGDPAMSCTRTPSRACETRHRKCPSALDKHIIAASGCAPGAARGSFGTVVPTKTPSPATASDPAIHPLSARQIKPSPTPPLRSIVDGAADEVTVHIVTSVTTPAAIRLKASAFLPTKN
jgi:hypothetical protein